MEQEVRAKLLRDDRIPFVPAGSAIAPGVARRPPILERALDWSQRWRIPLALLFVAMIAVTGVFAYESKQPDDPILTGGTIGDRGPRAGALSVAVGELAESDNGDGSSGAGGVGPAGPSTSSGQPDDPATSAVAASSSTSTRVASSSTTATSVTRPTSSSTTTTEPTTTSRSTTTQPSSTTGPPTTTSTTEPPTTSTTEARTTSTTEPTTTSTTRPPTGPAVVSGLVTFETSSGRAVNGLSLVLRADSNQDGIGESLLRNDSTNSSGTYSWTMESGCYVVQFDVPSGQRVLDGSLVQPVCVSPAGSASRNLVISLPSVAAPDYCEVQIGNGRFAGVEIHDPGSRWADSYVFFDRNGRFVLSTTSLGPPDDVEPNEPSIEWTSQVNGFEESAVYSVAAVHRQGAPSATTRCSRQNTG